MNKLDKNTGWYTLDGLGGSGGRTLPFSEGTSMIKPCLHIEWIDEYIISSNMEGPKGG